MKNVFLDLNFIRKNKTGIGFYSEKIFRELLKTKDIKFHYEGVIFKDNKDISENLDFFHIKKLPVNYCWSEFPRGIKNKLFWFFFPIMSKIFFKKKIDIWHSFYFTIPPRKIDAKIIITIHDLIPFIYPNFMPNNFLNKEKYLLDLTRRCSRADIIITVSEASKKDLIKYLDIDAEKIRIISPGIDTEKYNNFLVNDIRKKYNLRKKYILFLGALEPKKNIKNIIKSFEKANLQDIDLVIAGGKGWKYEEIFETYELSLYKKNIKMLDYIAEEDKIALYKEAEIFIFPSFYEGFGMPVLEAMAAGTPVITSNVSSLPEVAGGAAILVNPHSIDEISEAINKILIDEELKKRMIEIGLERAKYYTWSNSAKKLKKIYEELIKE